MHTPNDGNSGANELTRCGSLFAQVAGRDRSAGLGAGTRCGKSERLQPSNGEKHSRNTDQSVLRFRVLTMLASSPVNFDS